MRPLLRVAVLAAVLLGACGGGDDGGGDGDHGHEETSGTTEAPKPPAFERSEATTAVDVVLQDYAFVGLPDSVAGPRVFFGASIKGSNTHELEVVDAEGDPVDEIHAFKAPAKLSLAVELEPGTYTAQCLIKEGSRTHAELGMRKTFTVT